MKHKNDYTCIVFYGSQQSKKWTYVHRLSGFAKFLDSSHPGWIYFNVYDRRTRSFKRRIYKGNIVTDFL